MSDQADKQTTADDFRRREAERLARLIDVNADIVLKHLLALEAKGIIELSEHCK